MYQTLSLVTTILLIYNWGVLYVFAEENFLYDFFKIEEKPAIRSDIDKPQFREVEELASSTKKPTCGPVPFPDFSCEEKDNKNSTNTTKTTNNNSSITVTTTIFSSTILSTTTSSPVTKTSTKLSSTSHQTVSNKTVLTSTVKIFPKITSTLSITTTKTPLTTPMFFKKQEFKSTALKILLTTPSRKLTYHTYALVVTRQPPTRTTKLRPGITPRLLSNITPAKVVEGVFEPWLKPRFRDDGNNFYQGHSHTVTVPQFAGGMAPERLIPGLDVQKCGNIAICYVQRWDQQRLKHNLKKNY